MSLVNFDSPPDIQEAASIYLQREEKVSGANLDSLPDIQEAATERGSRHSNQLSKVNYKISEVPITKIRLKLMGFTAPEAPVVASSTNTSSDEYADIPRFCSQCGHKLSSQNFKFCPMCGNEISQ
jgi:rubrerythrin